ncbi:cache domain-containing protein [Anaeromicrobium sediminis]|uniref:Cache domain-containing protein n=1 Tax=Anaeromicrobium sediminis TaxID=1478221 RepID=A0A267MLT9_9FIRM|nr:cache domain-containing protein [Anaeromicrobium sediminis]PAB59878.1 hypothetical protein CCE28_07955 [Anaeromicrobium sediminis]
MRGRKLVLCLTLIIIIFTSNLLIGTISYKVMEERVYGSRIDDINALVEQVANRIDDKIVEKKNLLESISNNEDLIYYIENKDRNNIINSLRSYKKIYEEIEELYLGNEDKDMYLSSGDPLPEGYDPTGRVWYKGALVERDTFYEDTYIDIIGSNIIHTISIPMKTKGTNIIGMDIKLNNMEDILRHIQNGETSYMFLVDGNGKILIHPNKEVIGRDILKEEFAHEVMDSDAAVVSYVFNDENKIVVYRTLKSGFKLVFMAREQDLSNVDKETFIIIIGSIILVTILLCTILIKFLFKDNNDYGTFINDHKDDKLKVKLEKLKTYRLNNAITEEEYNRKRASIIDEYEI